MKGFLIDISKCNGCHNCQVVCKDEHCDQAWPPYTAAQPQTGQFWMRVDAKERGQVPLVRVSYTPVLCQHCEEAPCTFGAPAGLFERREDGLLLLKPLQIEPDVAERIASQCPVGAIFVNEEQRIDQKCNGCAHLLDDGWTVPRCVDSCPTEALRFGEIEDFGAEWEQAEVLCDELGDAHTLVRYLNLPKRFIGATVYDSKKDEIVQGATVTATCNGASVGTRTTDEFGDFLFDQIAPGAYTITIEADGYAAKTIEVDATEKDMFAGYLDLCS